MYVCLYNPLYNRGLPYFIFTLSLAIGEPAGRSGRLALVFGIFLFLIIFGHMGMGMVTTGHNRDNAPKRKNLPVFA